jgi:hypothetical protein
MRRRLGPATPRADFTNSKVPDRFRGWGCGSGFSGFGVSGFGFKV